VAGAIETGGTSGPDSTLTRPRRRILFLAICGLGISAFITQVTLMRELLSVFAGNELVFGVVLGSWLLLIGIGSALGKAAVGLRNPAAVLVPAQILTAFLPVADVFLLRTLHNVIFLRGEAVGPTETVVCCLVLLTPYCLIAGYLLTLTCGVLAVRRDASSIGQVYFLDSLGDIIGGVVFSLVLIYFLDPFQILYVPAALNLGFAGLVAFTFRKRWLTAASAAAGLAAVWIATSYDLDHESTRIEHRGDTVAYRGTSPYGRLVVTQTAGQFNFILNGLALFSTHNIEDVEEAVHFPMAQRPDARRVLLVSGGVSGTTREILKWGVEAVDYVELDPRILEVGRRFLPENFEDARIHVFNTDARLFVRCTERRYDVVILDVPDPSTSQINRFYTREFLQEVRSRLRPGGVVSFGLGRYKNFLSDELADLIATAHRTLKGTFKNVLLLPAGRVFFLASDADLTSNIAGRIEEKGLFTHLVNRYYLNAVLTPDRMGAVQRAVSEDAEENRDFSPILYYHHLLYWLSRFQTGWGMLGIGLFLVLLACLFRIRPVPLALFTTGLAASSLEVVLLMGYQILYGCLYHRVGLIVALFMAGLGVGAFTMNRLLPRRGRRDLVLLEFAMALFAAALPVILTLQIFPGSAIGTVVIPLLAFVLGGITGLEFPLAGKVDFLSPTATASRLYTSDYLGAALGALLVSTLLIPVLGVTAVCLLAAGLNMVSGTVILLTKK